jgi:alpha-1,2-mannosyltransferase
VVLDQLGRRRVPETLAGRVVDLAGLSQLRGTVGLAVLAVIAVIGLGAVLVLSARRPPGRLAAALFVVTTGVLLLTPPWSVAYTGLAAPAVALMVGFAVASTADLPGRLRTVLPVVVLTGLAAYGVASLPDLHTGSHFPGRSLEQVLAQAPGCVTTDDPIALIETGALRRNFAARCPLVIDPSGYSYDLQPAAGRHLGRPENAQWQQFIGRQLGSGDVSIVVRFRSAPGLSRRTRDRIASWPVLADVAGYQVRRPLPKAVAPTR